ncbi:2-oxoacid:acceptor oxidoreductase subunit alpha [Flavonifractor sp. DFI.6.63]|uniref:2-oxoacid:acceptor oxidoreductase subunit alpha n=1 Tax=Flavonifractor sp. DFI.6.63 TaxID=2963704 RepID=UPI00210EA1E9|nr:2-oxoacid:acceptor oxidoreductase subunit alpha [Flavonifractor sp. DFI.6.63]MCQ5029615.1 2-oxoacid:acceptor oxidoreductase subunit alpha [Flavonifractor sp. DFI.6.63]
MEEKKRVMLMQGNEACAEGAIAAGANFFAGYPITPATEIAEVMSYRLPMTGGRFIQMEDELGCMGAVVGASLTGAKAMTASSGPGFTLLQENMGYAAMSEVPCVIACVQRGGPSTGLATLPGQADIMQARWGTHGDHPVIALAPSTVEEMFYLTIDCFNLAEKYRMPVTLLTDAIIGHLREKVELPDYSTVTRISRAKPTCAPERYLPYAPEKNDVPLMANMGDGYRHYITGCVHDETGLPKLQHPDVASYLINRLHEKIEINRTDIERYETAYTEDAEILVMAYGCSARSAKQAVWEARANGIKAGFFRPISVWPFPEAPFLKAAQTARTIIIPEMNRGQYADETMRVLYQGGLQAKVIKINELGSIMIHPDRIVQAIMEEK